MQTNKKPQAKRTGRKGQRGSYAEENGAISKHRITHNEKYKRVTFWVKSGAVGLGYLDIESEEIYVYGDNGFYYRQPNVRMWSEDDGFEFQAIVNDMQDIWSAGPAKQLPI